MFVDRRLVEGVDSYVGQTRWELRLYRQEVVGCLRELGRNNDVRAFLQDQLSTWDRLQDQSPDLTEASLQRLRLHLQLADAERRLGPTDAAKNHLDQALEILEGLSRDERSHLDAVAVFLEECYPLSPGEILSDNALMRFQQAIDGSLVQARRAVQETQGGELECNVWNYVALDDYGSRNWIGAEEDAELAIQWLGHNPSDSMPIIPLFLFAGKHDRYHEVCRDLLDRGNDWHDEDVLCVAALCTLDRQPPESLAALRGLIERAIQMKPERRPELLSRAAIRLGKYQQAIEYLTPGESMDDKPISQVTLAIAHHYAQHPADARTWLERAQQTVANIGSFGELADPNRRMEYETLRHEAELLILGEIPDALLTDL
jgi:hypothetical protein